MARLLRLCAAALIAAVVACAPAAPPPASVPLSPAPPPAATVPPAPTQDVPAVVVADAAVREMVEELPLPEPVQVQVPPGEPELVSQRGIDLIIAFEIGSPAQYERKYQRPICPVCTSTPSGPTIGIGFDLGHATRDQVTMDWAEHPQLERLYTGIGYTGRAAIPVTKAMQDVVTPYRLGYQVFQKAGIVKYWRLCRRAFGAEAWDRATQHVQDALTSLCYNRGGSMTGAKREEMREIRDHHLPNGAWHLLADALRRMSRHWKGTPAEAGLTRRRYAEAELVLTP